MMLLHCCEIILFVNIIFECIPLSDQQGTWSQSMCNGSYLGVTKLPVDSYFNGSFLEVIDQPVFGPAIYMRESLKSCERIFSIPLPFSVNSIAYSGGYFHVIRDDVAVAESSWFRIKDVNLIGGFLLWMQQVKKQKEDCGDQVKYPAFNSRHQWRASDNSRTIVGLPICEYDLDQTFLENRVDLPFYKVYENGFSLFSKFYEDFKMLSFFGYESQIYAWLQWEESPVFSTQFTSVAANADMQSFLLTDRWFTIISKPDFISDKSDEIGQYLTVTSFLHFGELYFVCSTIDGTILLKHNNLEIEIGKLPIPLKNFYIFDELLVGISFNKEVYYSEDYFRDVILSNIECMANSATGMLINSSYCHFPVSLKLPFTTSQAIEKCQNISELLTYDPQINSTITNLTSAECSMAEESREKCNPYVGMDTIKDDCEENGCCYVEFENGNSTCFKKFYDNTLVYTDAWVSISDSLYEYTMVNTGQVGMVEARQHCLRRDGDLGFSDLVKKDTFEKLMDIWKNQTTSDQLWIGFTYSMAGPISFSGRTAWASYYNEGCGECTVLEPTTYKFISISCDSNNLTTFAICQRLIDRTTQITEASFLCKKEFDYCAVYADTQCSPNANCVSQIDDFDCTCNEGYTGDGKNCIEIGNCPKYWTYLNGKCYQKFHTTLSFYESEIDCQSFGGHLISIHNANELSMLENDILQTGDAVWLGYRKLAGSAKCNLMDGSDCNFLNSLSHEVETSFVGECLIYSNNKTYESACHLSMLKHIGVRSVYVCEVNSQQYFDVNSLSHTFDVYPGMSQFRINEQNILPDYLEDVHYGYIHLMAIDRLGNVQYLQSMSPKRRHASTLQEFLDNQFKEIHIKHIAVLGSIRAVTEEWESFVETIEKDIPDFPLIKKIEFSNHKESVEDYEYVDVDSSSSTMLLTCKQCQYGCSNVVISKTVAGMPKCEVFTINNSTTYKYSKVIYTSANFEVYFRSKVIKKSEIESYLNCPWTTVLADHFTANGENAALIDGEIFKSKVDCNNPPCIQQIACVKPKDRSRESTFLIFCTKSSISRKWSCPTFEQTSYYNGLFESRFSVPLTQIPFLATFDELTNLGSPHIEFQTSLNHALWSAGLWSWKHLDYGNLIQGMKGNAIRFSGQECHTKVNTLSDKSGITLSFWFRIVKWPTTVSPILINTGNYIGRSNRIIREATDSDNLVLVTYVSLGCWTDTLADRAIPSLENTPLINGNHKTRNEAFHLCLKTAHSFNFEVFALQDNGQCMGSKNAISTYNKHGPSNNCPSNGKGAALANDVYQILSYTDNQEIDDFWYKLKGVEYFVSKVSLNFSQSEAYCTNKGAILARLKNLQSVETVRSLIRYVPNTEYSAAYYVDLKRISAVEFQWGDGSSISPSILTWAWNVDGNCAVFKKDKSLNNIDCSTKRRFICRRNVKDAKSEIGVFINPTLQSLDIFVRTEGKIWKDFNIPIQTMKWTRLLLTWSFESGLKIQHDSYIRNAVTNSVTDDIDNTAYDIIPNHERVLTIGKYESDSVFDVDHLTYFFEKFDFQDAENNLPFRHQYLERSISGNLESPQINNIFHPTYPKYDHSCIGSLVFCEEGLTIGFSLKVSTQARYDPLDPNDHVVVISNLSPKTMFKDVADKFQSVGFSVQLKITKDESIATLQHTLTSSSTFEPEAALSWSIVYGITAHYFVQFDNHGNIRFCQLSPTRCKTYIVPSHVWASIQSKSSDSHTELMIGPSLLMHNAKSKSVSVQDFDHVTLSNLWVLEQSLDLLLFSDEIHIIGSPVHFQVDNKQLVSESGFTFESMGNSKLLDSNFSQYGYLLGVWNNAFSNNELADATWLEMNEQQFNASMPCLFNVEKCEHGFTLQIKFNNFPCDIRASSGNCFVLSTGGQIFPVSQGLAVYTSPDNEYFYVLLASRNHYWEATFLTSKIYTYSTLRISWNRLGLSVFINGVVLARVYTSKKIADLPTDQTHDLFNTFTIGKRNDKNQGFSVLIVGELTYWEGIVEGSWESYLGHCYNGWTQVGENCLFYYEKQVSTDASATQCNLYLSTPPEISSFAQYIAFSSLDLGSYLLSLSYDNGFFWDINNIPMNATRFNFLKQSTSLIQAKVNSDYMRVEHKWESHPTVGTIACSLPLVHDSNLLLGCYSPTNDFNWYSIAVDLHNLTIDALGTSHSNSYGSYNIPDACKIACNDLYLASYVLVTGSVCECILTDIDSNLVNQITPSYQKQECASADNFYSDDIIGNSYLNYPDGTQNNLNFELKYHCGLSYTRSYQCGVGNEDKAVLYGYDSILDKRIIFNFNSISELRVNFTSSDVYTYLSFNITFALDCCLQLNTCYCDQVNVYVLIDFADGNVYENLVSLEELMDLALPHFYTIEGEYKLSITVNNELKSITYSKTLVVLEPLNPVVLTHAEIAPTEPGQLAEITTFAISGNMMECTWNYGDLSLPEIISLKELPLPLTYHRYKKTGLYDVDVTCMNMLASSAVRVQSLVFIPIEGIIAKSNEKVEYGLTYRYTWEVKKGSDIKCKVYFGDYALPEADNLNNLIDSFHFDSNTKKGLALISPFLYGGINDTCINANDITVYKVVVICFNLPNKPTISAVTTVSFEIPQKNFTAVILPDKTFFRINEGFCINAGIEEGSNIVMKWSLPNGISFIEYCEQVGDCKTRKYCSAFSEEGNYNITVEVIFGFEIDSLSFLTVVEFPITNLNTSVSPSIIIPQYPMSLHINHEPKNCSGKVKVDFGDFSSNTIEFKNDDTGSYTLTLNHRYAEIGFYTVQVQSYNNVSSLKISKTIQVGVNISGFLLTLKSLRFLRTKLDSVLFEIQVKRGSEIRYSINFGDNTTVDLSESSTRTSPIDKDQHIISHVYQNPGNYTLAVKYSNIFGDHYEVYGNTIVVQNPLKNGEYRLVAEQFDYVSFPTGFVQFNAMLQSQFAVNDSDGYSGNVYAIWKYLDNYGTYSIGKGYRSYEIDHFPMNYTFGIDFIGSIEVSCALNNAVSQLTLYYNFELVEIINEIVVNVKNGKTKLTNAEINSTISILVKSKLQLEIYVFAGSHVVYEVSFGNNNTIMQKSPLLLGKDASSLFEYTYDLNGIYSIEISASNPISNSTKSFTNFVLVYGELSELVSEVSYVDFDQDLNGINIFDKNSEVFSVVYGKESFVRESKQYLPLSKPAVVKVSSVSGSNISIDWYFSNLNIGLKLDEDHNLYFSTHKTLSKMIDGGNFTLKLLENLSEMEVGYLDKKTRTKYDANDYSQQSTVLIQYAVPGIYDIAVTMHNPKSESIININYEVFAEVGDMKIDYANPPVANKTSNITFLLDQAGTESCYCVNLDGISIFSFGLSYKCCLNQRGISSRSFYLLTEDIGLFEGSHLFSYSFNGDLQSGLAQLEIVWLQTFLHADSFQLRIDGFNYVSKNFASRSIIVNELLCDFPTIYLEKNEKNSIKSPRKVMSFLRINLYTSITTFCKLTSETVILWQAYSMTSKALVSNHQICNSLPKTLSTYYVNSHCFEIVPGLIFSSKSEALFIQPRFLKVGLYLICVNVAMYQVHGINSSECIYLEVVLPPLVAGIRYGVRRAVGYNERVTLNAAEDSYDLDKLSTVKNSETYLNFTWFCPLLFHNYFNESSEEALLLFSGPPGVEQKQICVTGHITCSNSLMGINIESFQLVNESITLNKTLMKRISEKLNESCSNNVSCVVNVSNWLQFDGNETIHLCINISYSCGVIDPSNYEYASSNDICLTNGYYPTAGNYSCGSLKTSISNNTCGKIQLNTGKLQYNKKYIIGVRINDVTSNRFGIALQVIEITEGGPPILRISCLTNCNLKVNPRNSIAFKVQHTKDNGDIIANNATNISYKWYLYQASIVHFKNMSTIEQYSEIEYFENMTATGVNQSFLVINPAVLHPGVKYHVHVEGKIIGYEIGLTDVEIKTNLPPYGGSCKVYPLQGVAVNTTFTIACKGWKDEGINVDRTTPISPSDYTLRYQVLYRINESNPLLMLSYGGNSTLADKYLPPGLEENNYRVWIEVRIIDEYGEWAVWSLNATVYEAQNIEIELLDNLTLSEISSAGIQSIAQLSASVSGVLNQNTNETQQNKDTKLKIRNQLLTAVIEKFDVDSDLDGVQQSCSALGSLTEISSEVTESSQLSTVTALSQRTKLITNMAQTYATEDIAETASVVVVGIKNVIQATQHQFLSNVDNDDSNIVSVPIFSDPVSTIKSSYGVLNDEELYLSPLERLEKRRQDKIAKKLLLNHNRKLAKNVATTAIHSVNLLSNSILGQKLPGEPSVKVKTSGLSLQSQKIYLSDFCVPSNEADGIGNLSSPECHNSTEVTDKELLIFDKNPYIWDGSADKVRSSVVSLSYNFPNGSKSFDQSSNRTFRIEIPVHSIFSNTNAEIFLFIPSGNESMAYHEINIKSDEDVIFLEVLPFQNVQLRVYFLHAESLKTYPSSENYTFFYELPNLNQIAGNEFRLRLEGRELKLGRYVFGIVQIDEFKNITAESKRTLSNYTLFNFVTSCRFWNETTEKWETTGCMVSDETTSKLVVCSCNHLTSFGADFLVAPNPIDFANIGAKLQDLKNNLSVLLTLVGLIVLYILGVVLCRRMDKRDVSKWSVGILQDNKICDEYFYQVTVTTGSQLNANTTSNIYFVITGEDCDTALRSFKTSNNENEFSRGSVRKFLLAVNKPLGKMSYLKIWHDNSGGNGKDSWFLQHLTFVDLQNKEKFIFFCDDWLALDQSDGRIERLLFAADKEKMNSFKNLFGSTTQKSFSDGHLWFSLFSRPTKSNFTRVQRLSCALAILFSTMLSSAMFFGKSDDDTGKQGRLEIGPISFTVQQLVVSIEASLVVIPINILLVQMFERILPKNVEDSGDLDKLNSNNQDIDKKEESSKLMLPHWLIYVTWGLVFVVCLVSATFVFLYSVEWGAQKSNDWLLAIMMSFVQSVLIIQPCKVILVAVIVSFTVNKFFRDKAFEMINNEEEDRRRPEDLEVFKRNEEEWLMQSPLEDDFENIETGRGLMNNAEIEKAREAKEHHKMMVETLQEIVSYILYIALLLVVANNTKDKDGFRFHDSLSKIFLAEGDPVLEELRTIDDFWNWCDTVLIPGLYATHIYTGERLPWSETRYLSNRETFVTGPARLRQLRVKKDECVFQGNVSWEQRSCVSDYSILTQEDSNFANGWEPLGYSDELQEFWKYQDDSSLDGYPYAGKFNIYGGGGYAVTLPYTANGSLSVVKDLNLNKWVDRHTAAVFVEFSVYNANINLFASVVILFEKSRNGAFFAYSVISPIRLYKFIDGSGYFIVTFQIISLIAILFKLTKMYLSIKLKRCHFFKSFWNVIDFFECALAIVAIGLYAVRHLQANKTLQRIQDNVNKEHFVNFQYLALWNEVYICCLAFTVFLATIKFTRLLRFNRRILLLSFTLKYAAKPVAYFAIIFSIYFIAFMFLSNMWFEQKILEYSTQFYALEEMFSMLLGRFDFTEIQNSDPILGPIFFCLFTGLCTIALQNMFIVILDDSIKQARYHLRLKKNKFEVVDYMCTKVGNAISCFVPQFLQNHNSKVIQKKEKLPMDDLEDKLNILSKYIYKMEKEFYAKVSITELEQELK